MLIEVILYLFVSYVDAELFERVSGKVFEAEDVEQPDCQRFVIRRAAEAQQTIDLVDHPIEEPAIKTFGHCITSGTSFDYCIVPRNCLASGHHRI